MASIVEEYIGAYRLSLNCDSGELTISGGDETRGVQLSPTEIWTLAGFLVQHRVWWADHVLEILDSRI